MSPPDSPTSPFRPHHASDLRSPQPERRVPRKVRQDGSPHLFSNAFQAVPRQTLPARGLKGSAFVGDQLGVAAGSLGEDGAAVHVRMVVPSLVVPHNLERLAVLHNLGGQASQAHYPGEGEGRAGEGNAPPPRSAATPECRINAEKDSPLPQQTGETVGCSKHAKR